MPLPSLRQVVLDSLPGTKTEIHRRSGVHKKTAIKWLRQLHAAKEIYISDWRKHPHAGPDMPVYSVGNAPDVKNKLKKLTRQQIHKRHEAKIREDGSYDIKMSRMRLKYWDQRMKVKGDTLINALFGRPMERLKEAA